MRPCKFPDDLATRATGRRQCFCICNYGQICKVVFTFGERLPNRNAFGADCQTITRALDVAARVDPAFRCPYCRPHEKV